MLDQADPWFLKLAVLVLAGYFLWSIRKVLEDFKGEVKGLKDLIGKLFDSDRNLESRVSTLEGRCDTMHGPGGRRNYDPNGRLGQGEG